MNQAHYFEMTNFGVIIQIPGSRVVEETGYRGYLMKEFRRVK